jgi:hypothetical protein
LTSNRKIAANRANARGSTGPKTRQGRSRATKNALRHALSLPIGTDPTLSKKVEELAQEIAGTNASLEMLQLARRIAEADVDVRRVRMARHQFLSAILRNPYYDSAASTRTKVTLLRSILRTNPSGISLDGIAEFLCKAPEGPQKLAMVLSEEVKQLHRFDRYERRAISRRKFAIRSFDMARRSER